MASTKNNSAYVTAGKPNPSGACFWAPVGTALPTDTTTALNEAFSCLGYVSEDGVVNAEKIASEPIKAWGGETVLNPQTEHSDTFKLKLLEHINENVQKVIHGSQNVSGTLSTGLTVKVNGLPMEEGSWVFDIILTGGVAKRMVIPAGTITEKEEIVYKHNEASGHGITISAVPDANGNTHYEYFKGAGV